MKFVDKPNLPKEVFDQKVVPSVLAQAVRVHLANQRQGTQSALTRAEINRTRKKVFKQKGTGNARHGDRKAPIFVGGGVTFAPKPKTHVSKLPSQMKKTALFSALSSKAQDKNVFVVSGMTELSGKTSQVAEFLQTLENDAKKNFQQVLIITDNSQNNIYRASRNILGVTVLTVSAINTYEVLKADKILIMQEAVDLIGKVIQKNEDQLTEKVPATVKIAKPTTAKTAVKKATPSKAKPVVKAKVAAKKK